MKWYKVQLVERSTGISSETTISAENENHARMILSKEGYATGDVQCLGKVEQPKPKKPVHPKVERKPFDVMTVLPLPMAILTIVGVVWTLAAWQMDTSSGDYHNIGMIADREASLTVGTTILIVSVIALVGCEIVRALRAKP
jgi:hypothetical protein